MAKWKKLAVNTAPVVQLTAVDLKSIVSEAVSTALASSIVNQPTAEIVDIRHEVETNETIIACDKAEALIAEEIGTTGTVRLLSSTDRRGYTNTVNMRALALDTINTIRKQKKQKYRV